MSLRASSSLRRLDCLLTLREPLRAAARLRPARRGVGWLLALVLCAAASALAQAPAEPAPETAAAPAGEDTRLDAEAPANVTVWGREIVTLRASYGDRAPAERAREIEERTAATLGKDPHAEIRFKSAADGALRGMLFLAGSDPLFAILEGDLPVGSSLETEANGVAARLRDLAGAMRLQRDSVAVAGGAAKSVAALIALVLVVGLLERRLRPFVLRHSRAVTHQEAREKTAGTEAASLDATFVKAAAVRTLLRTLLLAVELFVAFLGAQFVLRQFPYTEALGNQLAGRLLDFVGRVGSSIADALPGLFVVTVIAYAARFVWRLVKRWTRAVELGQIDSSWLDAETARPTRILLGIGIVAMAMVIAYPLIPGSRSEAFKGVSVIIGVMVSLGGSSVIGQMISGLVVLYSRAVRRGDYITVGEYEGEVTEVGVLATRLTTPYAEQINIPSSVMVTAVSRNAMRFAVPGGSALRVPVTIGYDTPWRQVHGLLIDAAKRTPGVLASPPPGVWQHSLSNFFVEYVLFLQIDRSFNRMDVVTALHATILDTFNAHGVQVLAPHYEAQPDQRIVVPREQWAPDGAVADIPSPAKAAAPAVGAQRKA